MNAEIVGERSNLGSGVERRQFRLVLLRYQEALSERISLLFGFVAIATFDVDERQTLAFVQQHVRRLVEEREPKDVGPAVAQAQLDHDPVLVKPADGTIDARTSDFRLDDDDHTG